MQIVRPTAQGDIRYGFLALHIAGGQVGLPIIILTFILSKNVHRHPTLINFCITWSISSIAYCLLYVFILFRSFHPFPHSLQAYTAARRLNMMVPQRVFASLKLP